MKAVIAPFLRLSLKLLKALAIIAFFVHLLAYGVLHSNTANRYLADLVTERVPAFEATAMTGNLIRGLSFDADYRDGSIAIALAGATLRIAPTCLWSLTLCVEDLSAASLDIVTYPSQTAATAGQASPLAAINTPLPIVIEHLGLRTLTLKQARKTVLALDQFNLRGSWRGDRIQVAQATALHPACRGHFSGDIQLRDFYPLRTRIECTADSDTLAGNLSGDLHKLVIDAETSGAWPLGITATLSVLDLDQPMEASATLLGPIRLGELELQRGNLALRGTLERLTTDLNVGFASSLWQGDNQLELHSTLAWSDQSNLLEVELKRLQGVVLQRSLSGGGRISWQNRRLTFADLTLRQQENHISVNGALDAASDSAVEVAIDLPEIQQLWPSLSGALTGTVAISGDPGQPTVSGRLAAREVEYQGTAIDAGQLRFHLEHFGRRASDIDLRLQKVVAQSRPAGDLRLSVKGTLEKHQVNTHWKHPDNYSGNLLCRGETAAATLWQGQCSSLRAGFHGQTWTLRDPVSLRYDRHSVHIAPLCLMHQGDSAATVCSRDPLVIEGDTVKGLSLSGERLGWALLDPWLPDVVGVRGAWDFSLEGELAGGHPALYARLESRDSQLRWRAETGRHLDIPVAHLTAGLDLDGNRAALRWSGDAGDYGRVDGTLTLGEQTLEGAATVTGASLAPLEPLLAETAVESLAGQVDMDIRIGGQPDQPRLNGSLKVSGAQTRLENLPLPFEEIDLDIEFDDQTARLQGDFKVASAPGTLSGQLAWSDPGLSGELSLEAANLLLRPDATSEITLSPAVVVAVTPQQIRLNGTVAVPRARVRLKQLPAQAVTPSPDAVVLGQDRAGTGGPELVSDITLQLGDDVVFRGFGLDTRLTGELAMKQSGAEGIRAKGVVRLQQGRYRAYGQALAIRQGDLIFVGDVDNPQLRVEAVREMDSDATVVGLRATGPARSPTIDLFSQPEMAQQEKLHYLLTGRPPGTTATQDPNVLAAQTALSLGIDTSDTVVNKTAGALGIDNFRMSAESGRDGPEMRLSGYLSSKLLVRYGIGVFDAVNSLTLRYKVGRNLYIEAISGQSNSLDLLWSFER